MKEPKRVEAWIASGATDVLDYGTEQFALLAKIPD